MDLSEKDKMIIATLDAPGAGIPYVQKLFLRYFLSPFVAARSDWNADSARFKAVNAEIFDIITSLNESQLLERMLVPKQAGLEDSSRYWSTAMTFDHLAIVGENMQNVIIMLSRGQVPPRVASTAAVKPERNDIAGIERYRHFADTAVGIIDQGVENRNSKTIFKHPWFGPLTAHQWHWLLAAHAQIHLKQLRGIRKQLLRES